MQSTSHSFQERNHIGKTEETLICGVRSNISGVARQTICYYRRHHDDGWGKGKWIGMAYGDDDPETPPRKGKAGSIVVVAWCKRLFFAPHGGAFWNPFLNHLTASSSFIPSPFCAKLIVAQIKVGTSIYVIQNEKKTKKKKEKANSFFGGKHDLVLMLCLLSILPAV